MAVKEELDKLIRQILGDFPEGFNAGASAGLLGWPGDMAMMADTARLALSGKRSQRPPEEYPLTTDAIAAAAGYPVPKSVSGQLGAAVGGLLSPSPGDLGKFAPLLAIFAGPKAATASQDALSLAKAMDAAGSSQDDIWRATGELGQPWFKGKDGKWRFEIDDSGMRTLEGMSRSRNEGDLVDLNEAIRHDELFSAYPDMKELPIEFSRQSEGASYDPSLDYISVPYGSPSPHGSTLHEAQHAIQQREGFARGGSPDAMFVGYERDKQRLRDLNEYLAVYQNQAYEQAARASDELTKKAERYAETLGEFQSSAPTEQKIADYLLSQDEQYNRLYAEHAQLTYGLGRLEPHERYRHLAGETEARNVQTRMNMSMPERIATPPWMTQDVPDADQIVRYGEGPAMAISDKPVGGLLSDMDYRISHRPMTEASGAARLHDLETSFGPDIYGPQALQYFGSGLPAEKRVLGILKSVKGNPNADVTIYRGVPKGTSGQINTGDWVTLDRQVAQEYADGGDVLSMKVKASDLTSWADSLLEFGYFPTDR